VTHGAGQGLTHREIAKFSQKDADNYPKYEAMLTKVADFLEPRLMQVPSNPWGGLGDLWKLGQLGRKFRNLGRDVSTEAIEILTGAATPILDRWFESDVLKATIATDAVSARSTTVPCTSPEHGVHRTGLRRRQVWQTIYEPDARMHDGDGPGLLTCPIGPIKGLYLCGAAAHPSSGVMGAAGLNSAKVMLKS
jgi:phytoene dehydrogenase-like protein